jgi:hypothetical protein
MRYAGFLTNTIEILQIRKGNWTTVAARLHTVEKIFPFGPAADEVMIYGTVAYTLKDGRKTTVSLRVWRLFITEAEYMDRWTGPLELRW